MAFPIIPIFSFLEPKRVFDICQSLFSAQGHLVSQLCNLLPCFSNRKASEKTESAEKVFAQKDVRPSKHRISWIGEDQTEERWAGLSVSASVLDKSLTREAAIRYMPSFLISHAPSAEEGVSIKIRRARRTAGFFIAVLKATMWRIFVWF